MLPTRITNAKGELSVKKKEFYYFLVSFHIFANEKHIGSGMAKATSHNPKTANIHSVRSQVMAKLENRDAQYNYSILITGNKKLSKEEFDRASDEMFFNLV